MKMRSSFDGRIRKTLSDARTDLMRPFKAFTYLYTSLAMISKAYLILQFLRFVSVADLGFWQGERSVWLVIPPGSPFSYLSVSNTDLQEWFRN